MKLRTLSVLLAAFAAWYNIGCFAPYLPLFAYETLGASSLIVGMLTTVYWVVNTPSSTLYGYVVDRYGRPRLVLVLAMVAHAFLNFSIIMVHSIEALVVVRTVQGFTFAPLIPLTNLLAAYELGVSRGVGLAGSVGAAGFLAGSILGSVVVQYFDTYVAAFASAGLVLIAAALSVAMGVRESPESKLESSSFKLEYIREIPLTVWVVFAAMFLRQIGATGIWALFPIYLRSVGADDFIVGLAFALNTASQTILMRVASHFSERVGTLEVLLAGLLLSCTVFTGYYLASWYGQVLGLQVILGASWSALNVASNIHIIKNVRREVRATALGMLNTFQGASWIIGSSAHGVISEVTGSLRVYPLLAAVITSTAAVLVAAAVVKARR